AVPVEQIAAAFERIELVLLNVARLDLRKSKVGELVMEELKQLDQVGYVRFASVYRSFSDVEEFKQAIREVTK
ncbi:MAG: ATP cone domain-containing protein, partial [Burkholderiales bacterium]